MTPQLGAKCVPVALCACVCLREWECTEYVCILDKNVVIVCVKKQTKKNREVIVLWFWSFLCFRFFLTAAAARARAEETAWEGAEEALRGNGAAPQRGGEEARGERTGSYTCCSIILRRYYCMQTDSIVPQECETRWQVRSPSLALKFSFVFPFPFKATSPPRPPDSLWLYLSPQMTSKSYFPHVFSCQDCSFRHF